MSIIIISDTEINLVRKKIKNMHLKVYPPDGRVKVSVPERIDDETIRTFITSKLSWIKKQQEKITGQTRQAKREFISGENHNYHGNSYRLNVIYSTTKQRVEIRDDAYLDLYVRENSTKEKKEEVIRKWYRQQLKEQIPPLIAKWEKLIGVTVDDWGVKLMKTRWGTCNTKAKRIWINLELVKKHPRCVEYIVVHEMTHLLVRHHNDKFTAYMDQFLPQWRATKKELKVNH